MMPTEATNRRNVGWVFALSAAGYFAVLSAFVGGTEPFRFGLSNLPPLYLETLGALCVPLFASAICAISLLIRSGSSERANRIVLAISFATCVGLLLCGWGLGIVPIASPTALLAYRMYRKSV